MFQYLLKKSQELFFSVLMCVSLVFFSQLIIVFFISNDKNFLMLMFFSQFLFMFIPALFLINYDNYQQNLFFQKLRQIKVKNNHYLFILLVVSIVQISGSLISISVQHLLPENIFHFIENFGGREDLQNLINFDSVDYKLVLLSVCLGPAIFEEHLFRGYLQNTLRKHFSVKHSIFLTSIIFSILHFDILNFLGIFLLSCVIGYYKEKTNSLILPMLIHFSNNLLSVLLYNFTI